MCVMGNIMKLVDSLDLGGIVTFLLIIGIFIDISPIKVNPIGSILNKIGAALNKSIDKKVDTMKVEFNTKLDGLVDDRNNQIKEITVAIDTISKTVQDLIESTNMIRKLANSAHIREIRYEIISFANSLTREKHDISEFDYIMGLHKEYHKLIEENGETNGRIDVEMEIIQAKFRELRSTGQK